MQAAFKSVIVDSWARTSWSQAAEAGHRVVMSNSGLFYLDSAGHSAQNMWLNISARAGNATAAQAALLLGGETSMWQDRYVGSCLFPNEQDDNFTESVNGAGNVSADAKSEIILPRQARYTHGKVQTRGEKRVAFSAGCIWPRAAIAAGSFWGYYNSSKTLDEATFNATHQRQGKRVFLRHQIPKIVFVPRQARDKHRESSGKGAFLQAAAPRHRELPLRDAYRNEPLLAAAALREDLLPAAATATAASGVREGAEVPTPSHINV